MAGGNDLTISRAFAGLNRLDAPHLLPESESPDTTDAGPASDVNGLLGPRLGVTRTTSRSNTILGVVPVNLPWGYFRMVADVTGTWSAVSVPWPAATNPHFCSSSEYWGSSLTGSVGPAGMRIFITVMSDASAVSSTLGLGFQLDPTLAPGSTGPNSNGAGWLKVSSGGYTTQTLQTLIDGNCALTSTSDGTMVEGFIGMGQWRINSTQSPANYKVLITAVDDGVSLAFTAGALTGTQNVARGQSVAYDQSSLTSGLIVVF